MHGVFEVEIISTRPGIEPEGVTITSRFKDAIDAAFEIGNPHSRRPNGTKVVVKRMQLGLNYCRKQGLPLRSKRGKLYRLPPPPKKKILLRLRKMGGEWHPTWHDKEAKEKYFHNNHVPRPPP